METTEQQLARAILHLCSAVRRLDHMGDEREHIDQAKALALDILYPEALSPTATEEPSP